GPERARADPDPEHGAAEIAELDRVPHLDRALEEENQAGDEIVDDLLQAETDADAERAHEDRDPGQIEAERGEREEASDDEQGISGQVGERVRYTARQLHPRVDVL